MPTLRASVYAGLKAAYKGSNDLGTPQIDVPLSDLDEFTSGTGDYQSDLLFSDTRTLALSTSEDLDLAGVLADAFGSILTFVEVTAVYIKASKLNTNTVVIGNAAGTQALLGFGAAAHTWAIQPGGKLLVTAPKAGWTIGAGASDKLKVLNGGAGTPVDYDIIIMGRSA